MCDPALTSGALQHAFSLARLVLSNVCGTSLPSAGSACLPNAHCGCQLPASPCCARHVTLETLT